MSPRIVIHLDSLTQDVRLIYHDPDGTTREERHAYFEFQRKMHDLLEQGYELRYSGTGGMLLEMRPDAPG
jgi:hypothetical protein